jgi:ubiquinone/menaquinone biosynthesis C-methylase UbiE
MNALETWCCSSSLWRWITRERLLPWIIGPADLGHRLLEIGAGTGAATAALRKRIPRVISLEYDHGFAAKLARKEGAGAGVVQGDAAALPFADCTFSSATAILVLHHLRSAQLQDRAFAEIHRVLQPGGRFFALEIPEGWLHRVVHTNSTFVPLDPDGLDARLTLAGFAGVTVDSHGGAFRFGASRNK